MAERKVECGCYVENGYVFAVSFLCDRGHFQGALYQPREDADARRDSGATDSEAESSAAGGSGG